MGWWSIFSKKKEKISKNTLVDKDPDDFTLCSSSTAWVIDKHYCANCKCSTGHQEYMSEVCNQCGAFDTQHLMERSYRQIWYKGKWQYQVRYKEDRNRKKPNPHAIIPEGWSAYTEIIEKWYSIKKDEPKA